MGSGSQELWAIHSINWRRCKKEFFDFEEKFTFNASELGTGNHKISAEAFASWETHPYIKKGDAKNQSDEIEISIN